jgi:biopolymer transport protein ExbD
MARRRSSGPGEINAGSMADIAFLLLIFFLVTTTMDTDAGILRQLPPPIPPDAPEPPKVKDRDVYVVLVNRNDQLLVEGELMEIGELKEGTKLFMTNPNGNENLPVMRLVTRASVTEDISTVKAALAASPNDPELKKTLGNLEDKLLTVDLIGDYNELPGSAVISLRNDTETSYDMYIQVQNELTRAINELRDDLSVEKFGKKYDDLDKSIPEEKEMIMAVREVYPQRISEAEPNVTETQTP